jgi:hypothetical protein
VQLLPSDWAGIATVTGGKVPASHSAHRALSFNGHATPAPQEQHWLGSPPRHSLPSAHWQIGQNPASSRTKLMHAAPPVAHVVAGTSTCEP